MLHWFSRCARSASSRARCSARCGFAGVLAPLLGFPLQRFGGAASAAAAAGDRWRDDERDLALVDELCCGADHVDDGGAVVGGSPSAAARNDAAPKPQTLPACSERAAQRVTERGPVVAREPGAARLGGVGDRDLDDPRHPVDGEGGGLVPEPPHPVLVVEQPAVVLGADRAEPPRRGGFGVLEHRVVQRGDHVVAPVQLRQVGDTRGDGADRLLLWRCRTARRTREMNSPERHIDAGAAGLADVACTSAANAARSYQCGDDGDDGVHFDHARRTVCKKPRRCRRRCKQGQSR